MRISLSTKSIAESLELYIQTHSEYGKQLTHSLASGMIASELKNTLVEYDRQFLRSLVQISVTYYIAIGKLNRYPSYLTKAEKMEELIISLVNEDLKFNQRLALATTVNGCITGIQTMLQNGQSVQKIGILLKLFRDSFSVTRFYETVITVHDNHLEAINNAN